MSRRTIAAATAAVLAALALAAGAAAKVEVVQVGNLFLRDNGGISPRKLPRRAQAPISATLNGTIGTTDGSHPPALESVIADFDRTIQIDARGLPACSRAKLVARSTAAAKHACRGAIVGSGSGEVEVAFPEQAPFRATGPIVLFNGGVHGSTTLLLIHTYVAVPAPTAVIVPAAITRISRGHFGLHTVARIPRIAGGYGSVTRFKIVVGRRFAFKGRKRSYLTASCPTGHYFAEGNVSFRDGTRLHVTHALPCTPRG